MCLGRWLACVTADFCLQLQDITCTTFCAAEFMPWQMFQFPTKHYLLPTGIHGAIIQKTIVLNFFFHLPRHCIPMQARTSSFLRFLDHIHWTHHSQCVISLSQRPLTDNTNNRQTSMPLAGFKPTISAGERPQTYTIDRATTGTSIVLNCLI
jgi:hypothetical protein